MKTPAALLPALLGAALAAAPLAASGPYQITGTAVSQEGDLVRTEYTVSAGPNPLDRFKMIHLAQADQGAHSQGSILLLPPLGTTFNFYEQRRGWLSRQLDGRVLRAAGIRRLWLLATLRGHLGGPLRSRPDRLLDHEDLGPGVTGR